MRVVKRVEGVGLNKLSRWWAAFVDAKFQVRFIKYPFEVVCLNFFLDLTF